MSRELNLQNLRETSTTTMSDQLFDLAVHDELIVRNRDGRRQTALLPLPGALTANRFQASNASS